MTMNDMVEVTSLLVSVAFNASLATIGFCIWGLMVYGLYKAFKSWAAWSKHPAAVRLRRFKNARRKARRERKARA